LTVDDQYIISGAKNGSIKIFSTSIKKTTDLQQEVEYWKEKYLELEEKYRVLSLDYEDIKNKYENGSKTDACQKE
jgi:hypothetical protein